MPQPGFTPLQLYSSGTPTNVPAAANLDTGELAINYADGKLYYKDGSGNVQLLAAKNSTVVGGNNEVPYFNNTGVLTTSTGLIFDGLNFGINTTPPAALSASEKAIFLKGSGSPGSLVNGFNATILQHNIYYNGTNSIYLANDFVSIYQQVSGQHQWSSGASGTAGNIATTTQWMTLDLSGNLLVGPTTASNTPASGLSFNLSGNGASGNSVLAIGHPSGSISGSVYANFCYNGGTIGSITQSGTSGVAYNTTSDPRLKNIVGPLTTSGRFIDALNPLIGTWKVDGSLFAGFLTTDYAQVDPTAVVGEPNAVDANGDPIYQQMEYANSVWVANVTAELQSLRKRLSAAGIA